MNLHVSSITGVDAGSRFVAAVALLTQHDCVPMPPAPTTRARTTNRVVRNSPAWPPPHATLMSTPTPTRSTTATATAGRYLASYDDTEVLLRYVCACGTHPLKNEATWGRPPIACAHL